MSARIEIAKAIIEAKRCGVSPQSIDVFEKLGKDFEDNSKLRALIATRDKQLADEKTTVQSLADEILKLRQELWLAKICIGEYG